MPTILKSLNNALAFLESNGCPVGSAIYDDLAQSITQLQAGAIVDEILNA